MKNDLKSILKVVSSNAVNMVIGIIIAFIIPGLLGPEQYGYYSLFALYASYAGFFLFGFCDGFYLVYGGIPYNGIDKKLFSSYFYIMLIYLISVSAFLFAYVNRLNMDGYRLAVLNLVIISGLLQNINSYFVLLNQAASRFSIYAIGHVIEKIIFFVGVIVSLQLKSNSAFYFILVLLIGRIFTTVYFTYYSHDIVFTKPHVNKTVMTGIINNVKAGFLLTLSGIGTMLMTGIGRFSIEKKIGITQLGYYSFTFSVSVLFTQILSAVAVVLYPSLRKYENNKVKDIVNKLDVLIMFISGIVLLAYYPGRFLLEIFFPKYKAGMDVLLFLFPIVICESRRLIVYDMTYKVLRMEKQLVRNVIISLSICFVLTMIGIKISPSIRMIAAVTYLSLIIWNTIAVLTYNKIAKAKEKLFGKDLWLCIGYIIIYFIFGYTVLGFIISLAFIIINYVLDYKKAISLYKEWKLILGEKE